MLYPLGRQIIRRCSKNNHHTIQRTCVTGSSTILPQLRQQCRLLCTTENKVHDMEQQPLNDDEDDGNLQFGTRMYIERSSMPYSNDEPISKFIQFGLKNKYYKELQGEKRDDSVISSSIGVTADRPTVSDFCVTCLGTGSGTFTNTRATSCTALRVEGGSRVMLFDVGEGLQRQLLFSKVLRKNMMQLKQIFITHLHGDHIFGLIGLLLKYQVAAKASSSMDESPNNQQHRNKSKNKKNKYMQKQTIEVYGPPGIYNYIAMNLALSFSKLNFITVIVYELTGGTHDPGKETKSQTNNDESKKIRKSRHRHTHTFVYPEFRNPNLIRKTIPMNSDGIWILETFENNNMNQRGSVNNKNHIKKNSGKKKTQRMSIKAAEINHLPGVQTFGYVVEESPLEPNIDVEKAKALGLSPGPKYALLKKGQAVRNDADDAFIQPNDVLFPNKRPRKFALLGDNYSISEAMFELIKNADVLIHEATIVGEKKGDKDAFERGHATPAMAGKLSREAKAEVLLINHISCSIQMEDVDEMVVKHAEKANENVSQIVASYDFLELNIPRGGFNFLKNNEVSGEAVTDDNDTCI